MSEFQERVEAARAALRDGSDHAMLEFLRGTQQYPSTVEEAEAALAALGPRPQQLVITRGLPASGKTTWARRWVEADEANRARINRDDVRENMYGRAHGGIDERAVAVAQRAAVEALLRAGRSVVVDDTNLRLRHARGWRDLASEVGVEFRCEDWFQHVTVDECIRRDAVRRAQGRRTVGADAIRQMHQRFLAGGLQELRASPEDAPWSYVPDLTLPTAWLVDVDGTLAHMDGRGPFEWDRVCEDRVDAAVLDAVRALAHRSNVVVMSGRDGCCEGDTRLWLEQHRVPYDELVMRSPGDTRKDSVVKLELFREHVAPEYNVLGAIDDRDQVVRMWRSIGLKCLQAAPGNF